MYDLDQYIQNATRTESIIEEVKTNPVLLAGVLQIFIASGNLLDQIKKNVFYGKEYNNDKLIEEFTGIVASLDQIKSVLSGESSEEIAVDVDPRLFHSLVGIATESSELMEALVKAWSGESQDDINILEEFGDLNWYQAIGIDALNGDFGKVLDTNIEKLQARFPDKFTSNEAIERDLDTEREILEKVGD